MSLALANGWLRKPMLPISRLRALDAGDLFGSSWGKVGFGQLTVDIYNNFNARGLSGRGMYSPVDPRR